MTKWKLVPVEPTPEMIDAWNNDDSDEFRHAYRAMLEAAPQPPKSEPVAYIEHGKDWAILVWDKPDGEYSALYTAPPAPSVPDGWRPFLTDVITAAGLLKHGKRDKGLAGRIGKFAFDAMRAAPTQAEPPTDLPTWENGDDPLVSGGLINRGVVDFATVGIWPTKPAPSVPVEPMENIALNEWLDKTEWVQKELNTFPVSSLGMHRADVMRIEIERLREMLAAPPAPSVPDGWRPFLTDVITAAGLLENGKRDKGLAGRMGKFAFDAMRAAPQPPKLSDERILELSDMHMNMYGFDDVAFARAIEREILGGSEK